MPIMPTSAPRPLRATRVPTGLGIAPAVALAVLAALAATALAVVGAPHARAGIEDDPRDPRDKGTVNERFIADLPYTGTWADPTIMRVGGTWVTSATTVANLNLPVMTSTDLVTWRPRSPLPDYAKYSSWFRFNDAMPVKSPWALTVDHGGRPGMSVWAPSLAQVGDRFLAAYSAAVTLTPSRRSCIGIATAANQTGPYRDTRTTPLVCYEPARGGVIDPEIFVHPTTGMPYLLWKQEGVTGKQPPALMARRLNGTGTGFAASSRTVKLLELYRRYTKPAHPGDPYVLHHNWEGKIIENPSMIRHRGRYYLFYSGNSWAAAQYATGYAICKTPLGPCARATVRSPLLASGGSIAGPGGADAFVDDDGRLRLLYAAWDAGKVNTGAGTRRVHIATLEVRAGGRLAVVARG